METLTRSVLDWGVATFTLRGEHESGDRCVVAPWDDGIVVAVIDGLGHGAAAALAAAAAGEVVKAHCEESVISIIKRCHDELRTTRGVVMSLASFHFHEETMTWIGIGNVEGRLIRGGDPANAPEFNLLRGGVVGGQLPPLQASVVALGPGDVLLFFTDGIAEPALPGISFGQSMRKVAESILSKHKKGTDDAVVLAAKWGIDAP